MLEVKNLRKVYPNGYEALADVSFSLKKGEFVCVIGRSGAGKSTLLRCINGLITSTEGSILIVDRKSWFSIRRRDDTTQREI